MADDVTMPPGEWAERRASAAELVAWRMRVGLWPINWRRTAKLLWMTLASLYVAATVVRVHVRKYSIFLPNYIQWMTSAAPAGRDGGPIHLFVLLTDHFEPDYDVPRVEGWAARYRQMAARHHDYDGRPPQHSFFYPGEQGNGEIFGILRDVTSSGFGEVELHYHHGFDTKETFRTKLQSAIAEFQKYGFLRTIDGRTHFAFIHGNWGLDNSLGPRVCGVSTELRLLREVGCFADFTFPSVYWDAQPPIVNSIYAARDDDRPKSYARALPLSALADHSADLMIFEGPLIFAPSLSVRRLFLDLDDGNIQPSVPASPTRVDRWVRAGVHVPARPSWVFVKLFAHGISSPGDEEAVVGPTFDRALSYLEQKYNDGHRYILHYITAREAYNLVLAAVRGERGDPKHYLDSPVPRYAANASPARTVKGSRATDEVRGRPN